MVNFSDKYDFPKRKNVSSKPILVVNNIAYEVPVSFLQLTDTFNNYTDLDGKFLAVATGGGIEAIDIDFPEQQTFDHISETDLLVTIDINFNLDQNELQNARAHVSNGDPSLSLLQGQFWFDSSDSTLKVYNGSSVVSLVNADDDFHLLSAITSLEDSDEFLIYDNSNSGYRKITKTNLFSAYSTVKDVFNTVFVESGEMSLEASGADDIGIYGDGDVLYTVGSISSNQLVSFDFHDQATNYIFAGPLSGGSDKPSFRALVDSDMPSSYEVSNWNTAYAHSQVISGNPHQVTRSDVGLASVTNDAQVKKIASTTIGNIPTWAVTTGDQLTDGLGLVTILGDPGVDTNIVSEAAIRTAIDVATEGSHTIGSHSDVNLTSIQVDDILIWNGSNFINIPISSSGVGYWERNGTILSPDTDGDSLSIDEINEETTDAGVTIESVLIKDGTINWSVIDGTPTTVSGYGITDVMTTSHDANVITSTNISNWNTVYGWGDHSAAGYLTSVAMNDLSDVAINSVTTSEILVYNSSGDWINNTLTEAGISTIVIQDLIQDIILKQNYKHQEVHRFIGIIFQINLHLLPIMTL